MLVVDLVVISVLAYCAIRWLDRREQEQNRISELEWARRDAARAELALLNDGSWGAFLAERIETTQACTLREAA